MAETKNTMRRKAGISILIIMTVGLTILLYVNLIYPIVEDTLPVWELFLIFYILITLLWIFIFSSFWGFDKRMIRSSVMLIWLISVLDFYAGAMSVDFNGVMVTGADKWNIDYFFGYYITQTGLSGLLVWVMVYILIPVLIFIIMYLIVGPKKLYTAIRNRGA